MSAEAQWVRDAREASRTMHEFDEDACCIHCGFDGAEWHHWKHNTWEGRAQPDARQPKCDRGRWGAYK